MDEQRVYVSLTNRKATLREPYPYESFKEILKYRVPNWNHMPAAKNRGWDGFVCPLKWHAMGTGTFLAMRDALERETGCQFVVSDQRRPIEFDTTTVVEAREYQHDCVRAMIAAGSPGGIVLAATGVGKTATVGMYLKALRGTGLFLVDELTLLKQARAELEKWIAEPVGEIGDSIFEPRRITVGTIQTVHLHRSDPSYFEWSRNLQVMVLDELHLALNNRSFSTVATIQPPVIFGLTATLEMKKKHIAMQAYELCGPVVYSYPLERGVREEFLAKGIAIAVQVHNEVPEARYTGNGNWWQRRQFYQRRYPIAYRNLIVNGAKRNQVIRELVETLYQHGKYTILVLERIQHLKNMSRILADIPHELVFGEKRVQQRVASKRKFEQGELRLLLVNKVFGKGIDIKRVDAIVDGTGMKSRNGAVQKYGRGVRLAEGKTGLIYLDVSDSGNAFEKAAHSRGMALKKIGVPLYRTGSETGAETILSLAEDKLAKLVAGSDSGKKEFVNKRGRKKNASVLPELF